MEQEKSVLNTLRLLHIAALRNMTAACAVENVRAPSVSARVLHFLYECGGEASQKEVENEFHLRRSTASELLGRLEQEGCVVREACKADARSKHIRLAEEEREAQARVSERFRAVENYLQAGLTQEERDTFFAVCDKLYRRLLPAEAQ